MIFITYNFFLNLSLASSYARKWEMDKEDQSPGWGNNFGTDKMIHASSASQILISKI